MKDKVKVFAPAKINLFLRILGRRSDGYHIIRSGITFINLFDELEIRKSDRMSISYSGPFEPNGGTFQDCIIIKTLKFLGLDNNLKLNIKINKNIPVQGGLGSASTNAAALIKGLDVMHLIKKKNPEKYVELGSDIPCFLFEKNCLVTGIGERLNYQFFPKYYFLLVKPKFNNSTKDMYNKLDYDILTRDQISFFDENQINLDDSGNDFEKNLYKENIEFQKIFEFLDCLKDAVFYRMTGSGSCCYAVFKEKEHAIKASETFKSNFSDLWFCVCENNIVNI